MLRREFIQYCTSLLPLSFVPNFLKAEDNFTWEAATGLGQYISHVCTLNNIISAPYIHYSGEFMIDFPIEGRLDVKFKRGKDFFTESYLCFNPKIEDIEKLNKLSSREFYKYYSITDTNRTESGDFYRDFHIFRMKWKLAYFICSSK